MLMARRAFDIAQKLVEGQKERIMSDLILVAYASKHGATEEIAYKIGEVLKQQSLQADVQPADRVVTLKNYRAVILGSAVYAGQWQKSAVNFLETYERQLAEMPVWFFSSGPTGTGDPVELMKGWRFPTAQQPLANRIQPRDIALFHGEIDMTKINFAERLIIKGVKAPTGDYRDWEAVTTWAKGIAESMKLPLTQP
jgi:menaquinone-dependent protoporphyrinogen oxidase